MQSKDDLGESNAGNPNNTTSFSSPSPAGYQNFSPYYNQGVVNNGNSSPHSYPEPVHNPNVSNPSPNYYQYDQNVSLGYSGYVGHSISTNPGYVNQNYSPTHTGEYLPTNNPHNVNYYNYPQATNEDPNGYVQHAADINKVGQEVVTSGNGYGDEGAYKSHWNIAPEENELIKNRLSATAQFSSYKYKMLKLSELIRIQVNKSQFRKIAIKNFIVSDVDTIVETTSNGWIKLEVMRNFGKYNPAFVECIRTLDSTHHISGWKKSRGDGNCYYRAVITRYFEIIFGVYSLISNVTFFQAILSKLKEFSEKKYSFDSEYQTALDHVIYYTDQLKTLKEQDPYNAFDYITFIFQNSEFDIKLVRVSRMLTFMGLLNRASEYADYGMNITENYSTMILTMGEEAEEFVLMLLPLELCIQVVQYNIFDKVHIEKFPDEVSKEITVNIVRRGGHYDILYTKQDCEQDMFDFSSGTYHFYQS